MFLVVRDSIVYSPSMLRLTRGRPRSSRLLIRHRQKDRVPVNPAPESRPAFRLNVGKGGEPIYKDSHLIGRAGKGEILELSWIYKENDSQEHRIQARSVIASWPLACRDSL